MPSRRVVDKPFGAVGLLSNNTAVVASTRPRVLWAGDALVQKQFRQQCLLNAVNNMIGEVLATEDSFESHRAHLERRFRSAGFCLEGVRRSLSKGRPGNWTMLVALRWLTQNGYRLTRLGRNRLRRRILRLGQRGKKLLLCVAPPGCPDRLHAICIRGRRIWDGARGVAEFNNDAWDECIGHLVAAYLVK